MRIRCAWLAAAALLAPWPVWAQSQQVPVPEAHVASQAPSTVDVGQLPLSMSRLQRRLRASTERQARVGLNLQYYVDVFGVAPPLVFFTKDDNLTTARAPFGAPTHDDMIAAMTPRGFAPPPRGRVPRRSRK
jgi:uncharacterized protein YqjF (DUF2071 family)